LMTCMPNRQLRKMTDRYLLIRDPLQPLELNVIDNYQAGEIRSTKNLGRRKLIVSLALALGLSQMASRNVRVDSLFPMKVRNPRRRGPRNGAFDTGRTAPGRQVIGVISHVTALKERIGTQIQVTPGPGAQQPDRPRMPEDMREKSIEEVKSEMKHILIIKR